MEEIGADTSQVLNFIEQISSQNIDYALDHASIPGPSRGFTSTTFNFIREDQPHHVAAALALGREHIIPCMFRSILKNIGVTEAQAPIFHFYLNRHIHLDEDFHAPLSLKLLNSLCAGDQLKTKEAVKAAEIAVEARLEFWNGVHKAIQLQKAA